MSANFPDSRISVEQLAGRLEPLRIAKAAIITRLTRAAPEIGVEIPLHIAARSSLPSWSTSTQAAAVDQPPPANPARAVTSVNVPSVVMEKLVAAEAVT